MVSHTHIHTHTHTVCYKKSFTNLKAYINYSEDMYSVLNCHNEGKHTKFYLGQLWFNVSVKLECRAKRMDHVCL
jgi:hypothetical protein